MEPLVKIIAHMPPRLYNRNIENKLSSNSSSQDSLSNQPWVAGRVV